MASIAERNISKDRPVFFLKDDHWHQGEIKIRTATQEIIEITRSETVIVRPVITIHEDDGITLIQPHEEMDRHSDDAKA